MKNRMYSKLVRIAAVVLLAGMLAGCGAENTDQPVNDVVTDSKTQGGEPSNDNKPQEDKPSANGAQEGTDDKKETGNTKPESKIVAPETEEEKQAPHFLFETFDIDGNQFSSDMLQGAKLVMVNFWEPWCGPCVNEMPDIEALYEKYKDDGFIVLGIFSTQGQDDDVKSVMAQCGTTYPVLYATIDMYDYMTDYVPTTFFVNGYSRILSEEPIIGSKSYADWEKQIQEYLK